MQPTSTHVCVLMVGRVVLLCLLARLLKEHEPARAKNLTSFHEKATQQQQCRKQTGAQHQRTNKSCTPLNLIPAEWLHCSLLDVATERSKKRAERLCLCALCATLRNPAVFWGGPGCLSGGGSPAYSNREGRTSLLSAPGSTMAEVAKDANGALAVAQVQDVGMPACVRP